jgi:hypothetical protein
MREDSRGRCENEIPPYFLSDSPSLTTYVFIIEAFVVFEVVTSNLFGITTLGLVRNGNKQLSFGNLRWLLGV